MINVCTLGCDGELLTTDITLDEGALRCCPSCGQLVSNCSQDEYQNSLKKWDTEHGTMPKNHEAARFRKVSGRILGKALQLLNANGTTLKMLDIGCSSGARMAAAADLGFIVSGVEPAPEAAQTAKNAGYDVYQGYLNEANYPSETFDVITLFEIVEHIDTPIDMLNECHRILRPGGIIIINTPNSASWTARFMKAKWDGFSLTKMGGHISFFSPKSMSHLAHKTGFKVERFETRNVRFYEKDQCNPILYRAAKIIGELLAYPARLAMTGQNLLVYLRRADRETNVANLP